MALTDGEGRQRILDAAIIGFAERGYAGTTTAAVARAAKVTQPLVNSSGTAAVLNVKANGVVVSPGTSSTLDR